MGRNPIPRTPLLVIKSLVILNSKTLGMIKSLVIPNSKTLGI